MIEGVRDLFAEEGIEEQVLKDLKQVCQYKFLCVVFQFIKLINHSSNPLILV